VQPLDYYSPSTPAEGTGVALVVLPVAAGAVTLGFVGHHFSEEPFGVFAVEDAIVQVGGPVLVLGLWAAWFWLAARRRRPPFPVFGGVLCWAALNLWIAYVFLTGYFDEPWNR
jgi:hypothetical protein